MRASFSVFYFYYGALVTVDSREKEHISLKLFEKIKNLMYEL